MGSTSVPDCFPCFQCIVLSDAYPFTPIDYPRVGTRYRDPIIVRTGSYNGYQLDIQGTRQLGKGGE